MSKSTSDHHDTSRRKRAPVRVRGDTTLEDGVLAQTRREMEWLEKKLTEAIERTVRSTISHVPPRDMHKLRVTISVNKDASEQGEAGKYCATICTISPNDVDLNPTEFRMESSNLRALCEAINGAFVREDCKVSYSDAAARRARANPTHQNPQKISRDRD